MALLEQNALSVLTTSTPKTPGTRLENPKDQPGWEVKKQKVNANIVSKNSKDQAGERRALPEETQNKVSALPAFHGALTLR